jgi:hypothetical protein
MLIVGLHIARAALHVAVVDEDGVVADEFTGMRLSPNMDPADALLDFANRFRQQLHRLRPTTIALTNTRRYRDWTWAQAAERARLEAIVMLVSAQLGIAYRLVRQEDATRILEVPPRSTFAARLAGTPGTAGWRAWNDRAVALAAAMTAQREEERDR